MEEQLYEGLPAPWVRAILRAEHVPTHRITDSLYAVPSRSDPGSNHAVTLDGRGHIIGCTCEGWHRWGRRNPCRHAGAVAKRVNRQVCMKAVRAYRAAHPAVVARSLAKAS